MTAEDRCHQSILAAGRVPKEYIDKARFVALRLSPWLKREDPGISRAAYSVELLPRSAMARDEDVSIFFKDGRERISVDVTGKSIMDIYYLVKRSLVKAPVSEQVYR